MKDNRNYLWRPDEVYGLARGMFCFGSVFGLALALVLRRWIG